MYGVVNARREATLPLVVGNLAGQRVSINTVIDTGFDGFLSLPSEKIIQLGLPWRTSNTVPWAMEAKSCLIFTPQPSSGMGNTARLILLHRKQNPY